MKYNYYDKPRRIKKVNRVREKATPKVIGQFEDCKKCKQKMERREHSKITEKLLNKPYYYKEWDYCRSCKFLQHYDKFKVYNNNEKGTYIKNLEEESQRFDFFSSIGK